MKIDETRTVRRSGVEGAGPRQMADELAIAALVYLTQDEERLERFLALTGLQPGDLRTAATQPGFLSSVLDYVASDEPLLLAFAAQANLPPERVGQARDHYEHGA